MLLKFHRLSDHKEVDLLEYVKEILANKKDVSIYIGTDSQNSRNQSMFATVLVFHYGNHGGHVLYAKEKMPRFKTNQERLWKEVVNSVEVAQYLKEEGAIKIKYIDLDLNPDPRYQSNQILVAAIGWVASLGFESRVKSLGPYAAVMADLMCRS